MTTKAGKTVGQRLFFGGTEKASDVKARLKKANPKLSSKELRIKVAEVLTGKNSVAWAEVQVAVEGMRSDGYTPDYCDIRKSSGAIKFAKVVEPAKKVVTADDVDVEAMSKEEREALIAKLMA